MVTTSNIRDHFIPLKGVPIGEQKEILRILRKIGEPVYSETCCGKMEFFGESLVLRFDPPIGWLTDSIGNRSKLTKLSLNELISTFDKPSYSISKIYEK